MILSTVPGTRRSHSGAHNDDTMNQLTEIWRSTLVHRSLDTSGMKTEETDPVFPLQVEFLLDISSGADERSFRGTIR